MNELKVFSFGANEVRTVVIDGEPWWVAKDVAEVLGYSDTQVMTRRLDENEKGMQNIHTLGGDQNLSIINESGIYNAIIGSNKTEAKAFKKWITSEVIPAIRKTGQYGKQLSLEEMTKLVIIGMDERIKALENKVTEDAPKVESFESLQRSNRNMSITNCSKHFGLHPKKEVFPWLREHGYLTIKDIPTQKAIDEKILAVKQTKGSDGVYRPQAVVEAGMLETWRVKICPKIKQLLIAG